MSRLLSSLKALTCTCCFGRKNLQALACLKTNICQSISSKGPSINDVSNWEGGEVKNWSKLPTDSTKKLPTLGRGVSKIRKNCRRYLWMVPNQNFLLYNNRDCLRNNNVLLAMACNQVLSSLHKMQKTAEQDWE